MDKSIYSQQTELFGSAIHQTTLITGKGAPTSYTQGAVGCLYMDEDNYKTYKCVSTKDGQCVWEPFISDTIARKSDLEESVNLTSPNGKKFKLTVNNNGELVIVDVTDFYSYVESGDGYAVALTSGFKSALNSNTDYVKDGKTLWTVGSHLPNPGSTYEGQPVVSMRGMFDGCTVTTLDLSGWDVTNIENMRSVFFNCKKLTALDVSGWDTSNVTSMRTMFGGCQKLSSLNIRHFDMSNVENTDGMFQQLNAVTTLRLPDTMKSLGDWITNHLVSYAEETFTIHKEIERVGCSHLFYNFGPENNPTFKKFIVEPGCTGASVIDDVLYSGDGKRLIAVPNGKTFANRTFKIPEGVTEFNECSFGRNKLIDTIVLPNSYILLQYVDSTTNSAYLNKGNSLSIAAYGFTSIANYEVKDDNPNYSSYEGCIYSKNGKELLAVPLKYKGVLEIKEGTEVIREDAFWLFWLDGLASSVVDDLSEIVIPSSVKTISENQLQSLNELLSFGKTITIDAGNTHYAVENGQVVSLD